MRSIICKVRSLKIAILIWAVILALFGTLLYNRRSSVEKASYVIRTLEEENQGYHQSHLQDFLVPQGASVAKDEKTVGKGILAAHCVQPAMDLKDPVMMKFYKKMNPIDCRRRHSDFFTASNGTLHSVKALPAGVTCNMYPLIRGPGDYKFSFGPPVKNVIQGTPLVSEFFKINCSDSKQVLHFENIHLGVHVNETLKIRSRQTRLPANGLGLSVVMLGFDSMSRMSWLRRLPKTRDYFVNQLGAIELEGYGIMGDGTPAALLPMLTGKHENELPEARRNKPGADTVDQHPWIWKDFQKNGYITSWADSEINIAPFNYRMLGFKHSPTDFFARPFYLAADPRYKKYISGCHGPFRKHQIWFNYAKEIMTVYKNDPKFLFHFYATLSHGDNNPITMADDDLKELVLSLEKGGYLENTLLVLFADHGCRFSKVRATLSGKLEERTPYFALRFPKWFHTKHSDLIHNLKTNVHRLTTPMDIHETLKDVLKFDGSGVGSLEHRGISLFKEIPNERTCAHADIAPHWCACMSWKKQDAGDASVLDAVQASVDFINSLTKDYRNDCALLSIHNVTNAFKSEVGDSVLKFKETKGDRGLEPVLSEKMKSEKHLYQLTFVTSPGHGEFEVTLRHELAANEFIISTKAISRINKYGNAPHCILDRNRDIRQYCYCNVQQS